jgi:hypothetical protein
VFVRLFVAVGLLLGSPVQPEPPLPRDEFAPVEILAVEGPIEAEPTPVEVAEPIVIAPEQPDAAPVTKVRCMADPRCRGMRITGVVVGTLGLAAAGTGIGLIVRTDRVLPDTPAFVTSTRPAGQVSLVIGVGVTVAAVLILVASRSATKSRARAARLEGLGLGLRF